ncbi:MAG: ATP-dependent helicase, partial [Lachnospiraceae bacterium]|nr:ATP-dependent helicase [Lachnospiraceae bacterium]
EIRKLGENEGLELLQIYESYNKELKARSLMDYDDQMIYAYRMLKGSKDLLEFYRDKYRYICVDEAQDTSKVQHMIIALLSGEKGNLFMVGDEDQSIYGFRAAYPEALLHFEKEHPGAKVLVMNRNYRSCAGIVGVADTFIQKNFSRHEKHMKATRDAQSDVSFITLGSREAQYRYLLEMAKDITEQTAVLYRDNESVLPLVDLCLRENVPYRIKSADMAFFTHRVVVDVVNMLRFCLSPYDPELFMKIYFKFQTFLRKPDAENMCRIADERHIGILDAAEYADLGKRVLGNVRALRTHFRNMAGESAYKAISRLDKYMGYGEYLNDNNMDTGKLFILECLAKNEPTIEGFLDRLDVLRQTLTEERPNYRSKLILSTVHSSKGLEYDTVYLMDVINGVLPGKVINFKKATPKEKQDYEEERRIFYVGMTRAKDNLHILKYSDSPSIFVSEINKTKEKPESEKKKTKKKASNVLLKPTPLLKKKKAVSDERDVPENLIIGERISQVRYGEGTIIDVRWDDDDIPTKFTVQFDSGTERIFMYPFAFTTGMKVIR